MAASAQPNDHGSDERGFLPQGAHHHGAVIPSPNIFLGISPYQSREDNFLAKKGRIFSSRSTANIAR